MKFTKENGNITLKVLENSAGYGDGYVEIWVKDDGIGIPKHQVDMVFEKFFQVQDGQFKRPKGTGLGLTIVAEMIKLHKGYVWRRKRFGMRNHI
jgi:two-component system sensor histidine kinase VicK